VTAAHSLNCRSALLRAIISTGALLLSFAVAAQTTPTPQTPASGFQSFYFDTLGYTEMWVTVTPPPRGAETSSAVILTFTVRVNGKPPEGPLREPPLNVLVRAEANPFYNPMAIRQPTFRMFADATDAWDPDLPVNFYLLGGAPGEGAGTSANTVEVRVAPENLWRIAGARLVTGNAMGFNFELDPAQVQTLDGFLRRVFGSPTG
jgi:hypothetical protein